MKLTEEILVKLFGIGVYNALIGQDRTTTEVCKLISRPRNKKEAKTYYRIDVTDVQYQNGEDGEEGKRVILWNAPHKEELCTNCGELVEMARRIWSQKDWMPIEGYLGGIWDEDEKKEIGCVVLKLGEFGILVLKRQWDMK